MNASGEQTSAAADCRAIPIAITGIGCRLPGCDSPESYWEMILRGECRVAPAPDDRFDRSLYFAAGDRKDRHRSYTDLACTVDYGAVEAQRQQLPGDLRLCPELAFTSLLLAARQATENADGVRQPLPERTGVYVGHTRKSGLAGRMIVGTYLPVIVEMLDKIEGITAEQRRQIADELRYRFRDAAPRRDASGGPDLASLTAATLVSQGLGVAGPAMVFNSACASSLNALTQAVRALQLGEIDAAIVGSASFFHQDTLVLFSHAQSLSENGSRPFDADADGIVVGEGYAAVVLRRDEDAARERLHRHGVIRGVGIASDGKGKSLWAPRAEGQRLAVDRAYSVIDDNDAPDYVEAHATGTQLGDATELKALAGCLAKRDGKERITVGSVKSNIGHTLETAGLAGLIKAVMAVEKGVVPPTTGVKRLSQKVDWDEAGFDVATEIRRWPAKGPGIPRRVAVNAFGIGGLNVHMVIDQALPRSGRSIPATSRPATVGIGKSREPLAIVGAGVMAAGCSTVAAFWQRLADGVSALSDGPGREARATLREDCRGECWATPTTRGGYVTDFNYDWKRHRIPPKQLAHSSPLQFMILQAVEDALVQIFGEAFEQPLQSYAERAGVIVGSMFGGDFANQLLMGLRLPEFERAIDKALGTLAGPERTRIAQQFRDTLLEQMPALLDETGSFTSSSLVSRLTKTFDLMGGGVALDAGLCSGAAALACAGDLLRAGDVDTMICVGAQEDMTPTRFEALNLLGHLAAEPTGDAASGILPGEGCVALVLQRLSDAVRAGHKIVGVLDRVEGRIGARPAAPILSTPAQQLIGHTLGASSHFELLAELSPKPASTPPIVLRSRDFSGLTYEMRVTNSETAALLAQPSQANGSGSDCESKPLAGIDLRLADPGGVGEYGDCGKVMRSVGAGRLCRPIPPSERTLAPTPTIVAQDTSGLSGVALKSGSSPTPHREQLTDSFACVMAPTEENNAVFYDATQRRKTRLRQQAASQAGDRAARGLANNDAAGSAPSTATGTDRTSTDVNGHQPSAPSAPAATTIPAFEPPVVPTPVVKPPVVQPAVTPSTVSESANTSQAVSANELQEVLVEFVVDQTGYPPEMVEMDADLEADLGIDSIKKAQLLGELSDTYGLKPDNSTSLDDLSSLKAILDFTLDQLGAGAAASKPLPPESNGKAYTEPTPAAPTPPLPATPIVPPPVELGATPSINGSSANRPDAREVQQSLVEFVVDQTGYPPEMVEMDADLEADLGIDSIKKAQLLAELQDVYGFATRDDLTLDDFPDLSSIQQFVIENGNRS